MMDTFGGNNFLSDEDPFMGDVDRIELNLEGSDLNVMDSTELENLIDAESKALDMGLNDDEMEKLMNPDDLKLDFGGSDNNMDGLTGMPINEVEDTNIEELLGEMAQQVGVPIPQQPVNETFQPAPMQTMEPDPLLGKLSAQNNHNNNNNMFPQGNSTAPHNFMNNQDTPSQVQSMAVQVNALQRMVDEAINSNNTNNVNNGVDDSCMEQLNPMQQSGGLDLEQEKFKLLSRLNEINQRQRMPNLVPNQQAPQMGGGNMFLQNTGMMSHKPANPTGSVASLGAMGTSGETPLTSFLRKKGGSSTTAAASVGRSLLSENVAGAPQAASIFSESPMDFDNPLLRKTSRNQLNGAMDRSQLTQDMVRQLSASRLMGRTDSTKHLGGRGFLLGQQSSDPHNAGWEQNRAAYAKSSGMLPRHASDNHLLKASSKTGVSLSRSRLSRENLLYNHMRRNGSKNSLHRDDSLGQLLPIKRRVSKHKLNASRSVPHMMLNKSSSRGSLSNSGYQNNAHW